MADFKKKMEIKKDKAEGAVKEKAGKVTGNKKLQFEGKAQGLAASLKAKLRTLKKS